MTQVGAAPAVDKRRRFAVNTGASWAANIGKTLVQLVILPVMARLLGPSDFGLYALALPTVTFALVLADGGLGASLAREDESQTTLWSTAFWFLLGLCSLIALAVIGVGFILAHVSGKPELAGLIALLSLCLIMVSLAALPGARLARRSNLIYHSVGDLAGACLGAVVGIGMAFAGAGAWSLAGQFLTAFAVRVTVLNIGAFVRPTLVFDLRSLRGHFSTGGALVTCNAIALSGRSAENLLFGHVFGASSLGVFTLAQQIVRFVCEAATGPVWTSLYMYGLRESPAATAALHARLMRLLSALVFPFVCLLAAVAPGLFALALGPKWVDAAPMLRILAPFYALSTTAELCGAVLVSQGRNTILIWNVGGLTLARVLLIQFGAGLGETGVAFGLGILAVAYTLSLFAALNLALKPGVGFWNLLGEILPPALSALAAGAACHALAVRLPQTIPGFALALIGGGLVYLVFIALLQGRKLKGDLAVLFKVLPIGAVVRRFRSPEYASEK
ncbi:oligosaccharide flippase family protein [Methylobacterium sp. P31]